MRISRFVLTVAIALAVLSTGFVAVAAAGGSGNFYIADAKRFTMQFTDDNGAKVTITEADAYRPGCRCWCSSGSRTAAPILSEDVSVGRDWRHG